MIGGNTTINIQVRTSTKNAIGEGVKAWETKQSIFGFLDLAGGDSKYATQDAKIQESSHVFVSDYVQLDEAIKAENARVVDASGKEYDVMLIDDPMMLHRQLEIFLKFRGGQ